MAGNRCSTYASELDIIFIISIKNSEAESNRHRKEHVRSHESKNVANAARGNLSCDVGDMFTWNFNIDKIF